MERKDSWLDRNTKFIKRSVNLAFAAIGLNLGIEGYEAIANKHPQVNPQEQVDLPEEDKVRNLEKKIYQLERVVDSVISADRTQKDTLITSFPKGF